MQRLGKQHKHTHTHTTV